MSARSDRYLAHAERLLLAAEAPGRSRDERRLDAELGQAWATLAVAVSDEIVDYEADPEPDEWGRKDVPHVESLPAQHAEGFEQLRAVGHALIDTGGVSLDDVIPDEPRGKAMHPAGHKPAPSVPPVPPIGPHLSAVFDAARDGTL